MDRIAQGERKAFVVLSLTQTKIWKGAFDGSAIPQTIYERRSIPKTFIARNFNLLELQKKFVSTVTLNFDTSYTKRIARSLAGAEQVYVVARGKRRYAALSTFTNYLVEHDSFCHTKIHCLGDINADDLGERELLALARKMEKAHISSVLVN